jgi:anti-anti-sigma factor
MSTTMLRPTAASSLPARPPVVPVDAPRSRLIQDGSEPVRRPEGAPQTPRLSELALSVAAHDGVVVVTAAGALDVYTVEMLRTRVERCSGAGRDLVIDLERISLIDSAGLHTLRTLTNRAQASGRRLLLACQRRDVRGALALAGLTPIGTLQIPRPERGRRPAPQNARWIGLKRRVQNPAQPMPVPQSGEMSAHPASVQAAAGLRQDAT